MPSPSLLQRLKERKLVQWARSLLLVVLAFVPGCAPTFSDLQSARLVGPGSMEITPSYS